MITRRSLLQLFGITSGALTLRNDESAAPAVEPLSVHRTLLETFLVSRRIKPAHLARVAGYSRQHLLRVRLGRVLPSLACIAAIVIAARRLAGERVQPDHLFAAHVIRAAWSDAQPIQLEDHERANLRAAFGRRTLRELGGAQA